MGFTDGVTHAGRYGPRQFSLDWVCHLMAEDLSARELAAAVLRYALELDGGKPRDDMVVAVMKVTGTENKLGIRRISATYPCEVRPVQQDPQSHRGSMCFRQDTLDRVCVLWL